MRESKVNNMGDREQEVYDHVKLMYISTGVHISEGVQRRVVRETLGGKFMDRRR
jgi:hypothetical protein